MADLGRRSGEFRPDIPPAMDDNEPNELSKRPPAKRRSAPGSETMPTRPWKQVASEPDPREAELEKLSLADLKVEAAKHLMIVEGHEREDLIYYIICGESADPSDQDEDYGNQLSEMYWDDARNCQVGHPDGEYC